MKKQNPYGIKQEWWSQSTLIKIKYTTKQINVTCVETINKFLIRGSFLKQARKLIRGKLENKKNNSLKLFKEIGNNTEPKIK